MLKEQKIIVTITNKDTEDLDINISFEPSLNGQESEQFKNMTDEEKGVQNVAQHLAHILIKTCSET